MDTLQVSGNFNSFCGCSCTKHKDVLQATAELTDVTKSKAEFFNNKAVSIGTMQLAVTAPDFAANPENNLDVIDTAIVWLLGNIATFDAGIAVWQSKRYYDTVRSHLVPWQ